MKRSLKWPALTVAALFVGSLGVACSGGSGDKTVKGDIKAFAAGSGQKISGSAELVRRKDGTTIVSLQVTGLHAGANYVSHVHKQRCENADADGHFQQNGPAAGATPPNEIWLAGGPFVASGSGKASVKATADYKANADAVSVVVHDPSLPATANKVACANLS
jgi:hypothetical protein